MGGLSFCVTAAMLVLGTSLTVRCCLEGFSAVL
jgi:hypothetical protein